MNDLMVFENEELGTVRSILQNDETWFVAKDVTDILGYTNQSKALIDHVDEEDKLNNETLLSLGQRGGWLINESGLYSLILSSKMPKAKLFKRWVTSEVLPSIRKNGMYATDITIDKMIADPDFAIDLLINLKNEKAKRLKAEQQAEVLSIQLDESKKWYTVKRVAALNRIYWKDLDWRELKRQSKAMGLMVQKIFDANFGEVNSYSEDVWKQVYPKLVY